MKTKTITVYSVNELSDKALEKAYYNWLRHWEYLSHSDNMATLNKFKDIFPVKIKKFSYGDGTHDIEWEFNSHSELLDMTGLRLRTYIINNYWSDLFKGKYFSLWSKTEKEPKNPNIGKLKLRRSKVLFDNSCVLTGYWTDEEILDPIYKFLKTPDKGVNFEYLLNDCLETFGIACGKDHEATSTIKTFKDEVEANDWEFFENGDIA